MREKELIELSENQIKIIDEEKMNEYIQLLVSFDSWKESYYNRL